jgi:hypothetical protein
MLEGVVGLLDSFAKRTAMYVQPVDIPTVQSYLHGLEAGCSLGGLSVSRDMYVAAAAQRGWEFRATGIVWHMEAKGLSTDEIVQELIAVGVTAFRLAADSQP